MYVFMYVYMCLCMHVCMYVCVYVSMHACVYVCMCVCMCVCLCIMCTYICIYLCICVCMCVYVCTYVFMYVYLYVCMCVCGRGCPLTYNQEISSCWGKITLHQSICLQLSSQTSINVPITLSIWSHLGNPREFQMSHYKHFAFSRMWIVNDNHLFVVGSMFMVEIKYLY